MRLTRPGIEDLERLDEGELTALVSAAFSAASMRTDMADDAARMRVTAEMMGIGTHGVARVAPYVDLLRDSAPSDAEKPPRFPGDRALAALERAREEGVLVEPDVLAHMQALADV